MAVWEYLRFSGTWLPYPAEVCEQFEKARGQPGGTVVFVNAPGIKPHSVDVVSMRQIFAEDQGKTTSAGGPLAGRDRRLSAAGSSAAGSTVRRMLYPPDSAPAQGVSWQWLANNKATWYTYSTPLVCLIEKLRLQVSLRAVLGASARAVGVHRRPCLGGTPGFGRSCSWPAVRLSSAREH